ncbi:hypothetical protein LIER_41359 [Lithospermum erythrorhizon]|uniref:Zinc finger BED domain-containing protein RICESLEEPER 2-like n=1 Tax=Lithospermum erythrorhizon TaxID=34254 RepID=A0AAV3RBR8_LITER
MNDWGIEDKVQSCTVDNASFNDVCINSLIHKFSAKRTLSLKGQLFHVRCCAHMNLLVQDGLKSINTAVEKIRDEIKYILNSEARTMQFNEGRHFEGLKEKKLFIDVPTRWNSTFLMLSNALKF